MNLAWCYGSFLGSLKSSKIFWNIHGLRWASLIPAWLENFSWAAAHIIHDIKHLLTLPNSDQAPNVQVSLNFSPCHLWSSRQFVIDWNLPDTFAWMTCMLNWCFTGPISVSNLISIERTPLPSSDKPPLSIMHAEMKTCHTFMLSFLLMKWSQSLISCMLMHLINKNINRSCLCLSVLLSKLEDVIKRPKNQK